MDNKLDQKNKIITITFLEIFPPIYEIVKSKEDLNIVFQGNDNFYDFKKYLSSKTPIQLTYNKKSLIMTLLKSNNIFATGFFTIRQGEQNIIFNYENNKKNLSTKTVKINNLSECIKIKIICELENSSITSTINTNTISSNSDNKYVTKVNLMKPIRINNYKNKINKKTYEKKKGILSTVHKTINNSMKKNLVNYSQEFGDYTAFLTEEKNFNSNMVNNDIKKFNKMISNTARKNEATNNNNINRMNKAKSKNVFSTNKKQYKNLGNHMKINNSSLNIINQNNKYVSNENNNNNNTNNRNYYTNRNSLKSNNSYNKTIKRNSNVSNLPNKSIKTSLNNYISSQIIEHVNSNEKLNYISINKIANQNIIYSGNTNDTKKIKANNNNITMNSISTNVTKKNDLEFSINSMQDIDDKNFLNYNTSNKNTLRSFTNRTNNERLTQKINADKNNVIDNTNKNSGKHKFNKSLCQQSFTEKIFSENNDFNLNLTEGKEKYIYKLCRSENKLVVKYNENEINDMSDNNDKIMNNNNEFHIEENDIDLSDNNYTKLKEDFNLLYNLEYISKIKEDLLKLEAELFIEKMSELFNEYHTQMDEQILERNIINREYKTNFGNYLAYDKLKGKLDFIKKKYNKEKDKNVTKQNNENIKTNMNELDIFKILFPKLINNNEETKKNDLKNILDIILKKEENQELIKEKYDKLKSFYKNQSINN